jgi:hypothetical protein
MRVSRALVVASFAVAGCPQDPPPTKWETGLDLGRDEGAVFGIWGRARDDVYAAGGNVESADADGAGVVFHFDGSDWTREALEGTDMLNWVFGTDNGDVWVTGYGGQAARLRDTSWERIDTPTDEPLWGLWGPAHDDLWAVGGDPFASDPVIVHYDGSAWTQVVLPVLDREVPALFKVWGSAGDDVWAVGQRGLVLHYDGSTWEQTDAGTQSDLISLWGRGPDDVLVVGGRSNGVLLRYDGTDWTEEQTALAGLNGVWMDAEGEATVAGMLGATAAIEAGSFAYEEEDVGVSPLTLHGVFGFDDGARFLGGGDILSAAPWQGVLVQHLP